MPQVEKCWKKGDGRHFVVNPVDIKSWLLIFSWYLFEKKALKLVENMEIGCEGVLRSTENTTEQELCIGSSKVDPICHSSAAWKKKEQPSEFLVQCLSPFRPGPSCLILIFFMMWLLYLSLYYTTKGRTLIQVPPVPRIDHPRILSHQCLPVPNVTWDKESNITFSLVSRKHSYVVDSHIQTISTPGSGNSS